MLLILQDLNEGALINAQSSNATVLDNEDKVGKITGGVVGLQLSYYSMSSAHTCPSIPDNFLLKILCYVYCNIYC